jgi:hypothetical protein
VTTKNQNNENYNGRWIIRVSDTAYIYWSDSAARKHFARNRTRWRATLNAKFFSSNVRWLFFHSEHIPPLATHFPHITTIGASIDQARGYKVSIACDSTDTSRGSDFRALYFQTFESDHENFQPVAQQLAWQQTCGSSSVGL